MNKWKASIVDVSKQVDVAIVVVEYTDGVTTLTETYRAVDIESVKETARNQIAKFVQVKDTVFPVGELDLSLPVEEVPTTSDIETKEFMEDYIQLVQYKKAISAGLAKEDDVKYVDLQTKVKLSWKEEYVPLIAAIRA